MTVIYRQLIMNDISLFTSQPKAKFYDELFFHLDLDSVTDRRCEKGRRGYSRYAMICAVIVMKCECFTYVTDLVYDHHLNTEDAELFQLIVETTLKHRDDRLRLKLEEINLESDNPEKYLNSLIILGSKLGLKRYYEITKKSMTTVNLKDETSIDPVTDSISTLNNPDLLEEIDQLGKLLFTPGFVDREMFGLYNSLFRAYQNIAKKDYSLVKEHLSDTLKMDTISDDEKGFCNTVLADIEEEHNTSENIIWSIEGIKKFFESH